MKLIKSGVLIFVLDNSLSIYGGLDLAKEMFKIACPNIFSSEYLVTFSFPEVNCAVTTEALFAVWSSFHMPMLNCSIWK